MIFRNGALAQVMVGDCRESLRQFAAGGGRVQTCVTSPPYFGLRSYMPDAVCLRQDLSPEQSAAILAELRTLGVHPTSD